MKLELHWLEPDGTWKKHVVQAAETFEYRGVRCAIHRPLTGTPNTWCVTEVSKGLSIVNFVLGTKREAQRAAYEVLGTKNEEQWAQWLNKFDISRLH